jgi:uncharacterized protein (DUF488 family)
MTVYTIGHGNRAIGELVGLLGEAGIECLVDVRAYPASRRHPQFSRDALDRSLAEAGIRYVWEGKSLGGRRKAAKDSPHVALRSAGFRAYADHMETEDFRAGLGRLLELAGAGRTAIMCAERLPWECHRNLISDRLVADGNTVLHMIGAGPGKEHRLNAVARLHEGTLIYDGGAQAELRI